jgi:cytochrome c oxidase subunit 1
VLITNHGAIMIFWVAMPVLIAAFGNFLIPLMLGCDDMVFPRINRLSYQIFFLSAAVLMCSFFVQGGAFGGAWTIYPPLSAKSQYNLTPLGSSIFLVAVALEFVAFLLGGINFVTTAMNSRAPGMKMYDIPMVVWMIVIASILFMASVGPLIAGAVMLFMDQNIGTAFFDPDRGGDPVLWQHLFWLFGHPEVYILILPAFGIVSEILPVFSRKPLFGYAAMVFSGCFIAFLGFGVWSHHMFSTGMGPIADTVFSLGTMLIAIPTGVKIFNWIGTVVGGSIQYKTPMYFALGFVAMFIIGGLSGVMHASPPADLQQTDSYFIVAHFHYVLFGGSIFALTGGAYYWFPKMTGRMLSEALGKLHFWLMFIGFNLTFAPMHILGLNGMPRRVYTYSAETGFGFWNGIETAGSLILGVSFLVFILNVVKSLRAGEKAPADPWNGATLEWSIPSPPQEWNFAVEPTVDARDALWELKRARGGALPEPERVSGWGIHLPSPSYWPIVTAIGTATTLIGFLMHVTLAVILAGVAITMLGIFSWAFEPADH